MAKKAYANSRRRIMSPEQTKLCARSFLCMLSHPQKDSVGLIWHCMQGLIRGSNPCCHQRPAVALGSCALPLLPCAFTETCGSGGRSTFTSTICTTAAHTFKYWPPIVIATAVARCILCHLRCCLHICLASSSGTDRRCPAAPAFVHILWAVYHFFAHVVSHSLNFQHSTQTFT